MKRPSKGIDGKEENYRNPLVAEGESICFVSLELKKIYISIFN
jgi:hypothetical protein